MWGVPPIKRDVLSRFAITHYTGVRIETGIFERCADVICITHYTGVRIETSFPSATQSMRTITPYTGVRIETT